jgi:large subunit ribosomal protein L31e
MEEDKEEEEQKTGEEPKESAETVEEAVAETEVEEEIEDVSAEEEEKEEIPEEEAEVVDEEAVEAEGEEMPAPVEEEAKPPTREEKVEEEEIVEERVYTIPLGKCWIAPSNRRASRALRVIRSFVVKHMKLEARGKEEEGEEEPKRLVIDNDVNERVWGRGMQKPPRKIRVRAAKDKEGNVTVYLAEGD